MTGGESGESLIPSRSSDHPKKKSILKKDAISPEETETLLHDVRYERLENGDDGRDSPTQQGMGEDSDSDLFSSIPPPSHHTPSIRTHPPPKLAPPPKIFSPQSKVKPIKFVGIVNADGAVSPISPIGSTSSPSASPGMLKNMKEMDNQDQHHFQDSNITADKEKHLDPSKHREKSEESDKEKDDINLINSVGGNAIDDSTIAFIDEPSTPGDTFP